MKSKIFLKKAIKKTLYAITPKKTLPEKTIFINKDTWPSFDVSEYKDCNKSGYTFVCDKIERFQKKSLGNIVAYMGGAEKKYLSHMTGLKWLQLASHGFNGFENKEIYANKDVNVTNLKDVYATPIAQYCISAYYLFNCYALRKAMGNVKLQDLKPNFTPTITIVGAGNIGSKVAQIAKSHGWTVYGIKRSVTQIPYFDSIGTFDDIDLFLSKSDYVINLLPETNETHKIYNKKFFPQMRRDAIFCNVGRGASVDERALESAVKNGTIRGAIIDASSGYKYHHKNILCTHHMSSFSPENKEDIAKFYSAQLKEFLLQ